MKKIKKMDPLQTAENQIIKKYKAKMNKNKKIYQLQIAEH